MSYMTSMTSYFPYTLNVTLKAQLVMFYCKRLTCTICYVSLSVLHF